MRGSLQQQQQQRTKGPHILYLVKIENSCPNKGQSPKNIFKNNSLYLLYRVIFLPSPILSFTHTHACSTGGGGAGCAGGADGACDVGGGGVGRFANRGAQLPCDRRRQRRAASPIVGTKNRGEYGGRSGKRASRIS